MDIIIVLSGILFILTIVLIVLRQVRARKRSNTLMVVLGSGGHTGEMFSLLKSLFPQLTHAEKEGEEVKPSLGDIDSLLFVTSANDELSLRRLASVKLAYKRVSITRARDVHESLISAAPKIISSLLQSLYLLYTVRPAVLLTNGPGVCVPLLFAARLLSPATECIFVESVCRTRTLSLTGKILYRLKLVRHFFVQWPRLHQLYPRSRYIGLLV